MPDFIAVQCFQCNQYQVSQKRKDSKFNCKLCHAKQSVKKVFAHSDRASDVRKFIQPLNLARGRAEEQYDQQHPYPQEDNDDEERLPGFSDALSQSREPLVPVAQSRWQPFSIAVAKRFRSPDVNDTDEFGDSDDDIITALPDIQGKTRRRKRQRLSRQQRGELKNDDKHPTVDAGYSNMNQKASDEPVRKDNPRRYQWGAGTSLKATNATTASQRGAFGGSNGGSQTWGSGRSRFPQLQTQPRSDHASDNLKSRWGDIARSGPQNPGRKASQASSIVPTSLDTDGLITTFGADEVVQDEILY